MAAAKTTPAKKNKTAKTPPYNLHSLFPTNVLSRDWPDVEDVNESLKAQIWRLRALDPDGIYRSNMSGTWHSKDKILEELGDAGKTLKDMFGRAFVEWGGLHGLKKEESVRVRLSAWAMVYSDRGYATVHTHPNCHASGVYYVDDTTAGQEQVMATGVPVRAGDIEFVDTRRGGEQQVSHMRLNPPAVFSFNPGRMLVFPSALPHFVHPVIGPGERIAIACNATFLPPATNKETKHDSD